MLQGRTLNALEAAAEVVGKGSGVWSTLDLLLQSGQSAVQLQKGNVTGYWSGENFWALQPPQPQASVKVVTPGAELRVTVTDQGRRRPVRLLGSCNGGYLLDRQVCFFVKLSSVNTPCRAPHFQPQACQTFRNLLFHMQAFTLEGRGTLRSKFDVPNRP